MPGLQDQDFPKNEDKTSQILSRSHNFHDQHLLQVFYSKHETPNKRNEQ